VKKKISKASAEEPFSGRDTFEKARERNYQFKLRAILDTAAHLFNRKGFGNTSLSDVADHLGITKNALYYYVQSKEDLIYQCYRLAVALNEEMLQKADQPGLTGRQKLESWLRLIISDKHGNIVVMTELPSLPEPHRSELIRRVNTVELALRGFILEGIADKSIRECDPKMAEFWLMAAPSWLPKWFTPKGDRSAAEIADIFIDYTFNGLAPR